jgi:pimeloyl-ACP methyl ester carboxylesterase
VEPHENRVIVLPDGRRVGWAEYGDPDGVPVMALHGAPACRLMFGAGHVAAVRLGLRLIAPDRPGYGLTPPDAAPTLATRTQWHAAFADALGLQRFGIFGISGGAPYAVALAAHLKERITGLALVSPIGPVADYMASGRGRAQPIPLLQRRFFLHLPARPWLLQPMAVLAARTYLTAPDRIGWLAVKAVRSPDAAILNKLDVHKRMTAMTCEALRQGSIGGARDLTVYSKPWQVDFSWIAAPAVLWQGTQDAIVPPAAAFYLARLLPRCRVERIEGAGHFWVFDHVEEVMTQIRSLVAPPHDPP